MQFSLLLLGMLPLVSAEACYSVITKTSLVTSVVTTVSLSTFTDNVCLPAATTFPVSDSHEKPATFTTISTTIADLPLPTDFETISSTAPTFSLSTFAQDESDTQLQPTSSTGGTPGPVSSTLTSDESSTEVEGEETATSSLTSSTELSITISITDSDSIVVPTSTTLPGFNGNTTTIRPGGVASTPLETLPETTQVSTSTTSSEVSSATTPTTPTTSAEIVSTVSSSSVDETTIVSSTEPVEEPTDLSTTTTCAETSATTTSEATPSDEVSETSLTSDCETSTTTLEELPTSITPTTTTTSGTPVFTTSVESTIKESTSTTIESTSPTSDDVISSTSISSTSISSTSISSTSTSSTSTSSTPAFSTSTSTSSLSTESTTTSHVDDETTSSVSSSTTTAPAPQYTNPPRNGYYPADIVDELRDESIDKLEAHLQENASGCTLENAKVRREWSDLPVKQREEYIEAVLCLQSLPAKSGSGAPGARSRFDDFLAVHIKQTDYIHGTANFLTWHRYFLFTYEKALKEECGYAGEHPYWNWDRYAADPAGSPLFNGNSSSISGGSINGGCVASGPFKDMAVNMGPGPSLKYNPRCLKRDMSARWAAQTTVETVYPLITQSNDIARFQDTFQNPGNAHAGGHFTIGGDPGGDIYASAGDPAFYLHHAMVDRIYWLWQLQDLDTRLHTVAGQNKQTRQPGALTDLVDLGINGGDVEIGDLLNTMGGLDGELCYIYA